MALEREATRRLRLAVLLLLATASCSLVSVEEQLPPATLELLARWRSLEDPADLAGVRVEVTAAGPTQAYTASDFMGSQTEPFPVPDTGQATVAVQVRQGGETVAQGSVSWYLRGPGWTWELHIARGRRVSHLYAEAEDCNENECPENTRLRCSLVHGSFCRGAWRFAVREDAARFEDESLWLWLRGVPHDPCPEGVLCD